MKDLFTKNITACTTCQGSGRIPLRLAVDNFLYPAAESSYQTARCPDCTPVKRPEKKILNVENCSLCDARGRISNGEGQSWPCDHGFSNT